MLYNSPKSLLDSVSKLMNESKVKYDQEQKDLEEAQKALWEKKLGKKPLHPNQQKIDVVDDEKIDGKDFAKLRSMKKEEVEAVEEGLGDKVKAAAKAVGKALTGGSDEDQLKNLQKKMGLPQTGKKPEVKEEAEIEENADCKTKKPAKTLKAMREQAALDEARGRPRKNPSPEASTEDEADQNIVMHLKKSVDTGGNHDVKFGDKSTHKVPHHVATAVLGAMGKLKPADRLEVQKHIHQSHSNLMQVHGMIK